MVGAVDPLKHNFWNNTRLANKFDQQNSDGSRLDQLSKFSLLRLVKTEENCRVDDATHHGHSCSTRGQHSSSWIPHCLASVSGCPLAHWRLSHHIRSSSEPVCWQQCYTDCFPYRNTHKYIYNMHNSWELECGPMPNVMVALPNIGGALCSTPQFGWRPLLECRAVTLPRRENRWNYLGCPKLTKRSQLLVSRSSPYCADMQRRYCCLTSFFPDCRYMP